MWNRLEVSRARDPENAGVYRAKNSSDAGYPSFFKSNKIKDKLALF